MLEIDLEGTQVSIIDADQRCPCIEHARQVRLVVQLDEGRHSQLACLVEQLPQIAIVQALGNQKHRIGAGPLGCAQGMGRHRPPIPPGPDVHRRPARHRSKRPRPVRGRQDGPPRPEVESAQLRG